MNEDAINNYFHYLEESLKDFPASNLFSYDETNVTDDPGSKQVITHYSKSYVSVMFAGSADGTYLPPMVVYKSENIYRE